MAPALVALLGAVMLGTAFLSGIFGMAGGMILMGVLLAVMSVPDAMALHGVTQMASNASRGLSWWRHARLHAVAAYLSGCAIAFLVWACWRYVPPKPLALACLGVTPFLLTAAPSRLRPDPDRLLDGVVFGAISMTLMLLTGVAGPLLDAFFLGGRLDRRAIVATKAICQFAGHGAKLVYFGVFATEVASLDPQIVVIAVLASIAGTAAARPVLLRLSDSQYRVWATRLVAAIACTYLAQAAWLLASPPLKPGDYNVQRP